jgi:hypothetical protein
MVCEFSVKKTSGLTEFSTMRVPLDSGITATNCYLARALNPQSSADWLTAGNPFIYGVHLDVGFTKVLPAGTHTPTVRGLTYMFRDTGCTLGATVQQRVIDSWVYLYVNNSQDDLKLFYSNVEVRSSQNSGDRTGIFYVTGGVYDAATIAYDPMCSYYTDFFVRAGCTISSSYYAYYMQSDTFFDGAVTGNISSFYADWNSGSTVTCANLIAHGAAWDVSGATVSGYAAGFSTDINANTRTFSVHGARVNITGTIGASGFWRGYSLDATGVVCGAGEFFYGIDIDFTGIGTGGDIRGINLISCNLYHGLESAEQFTGQRLVNKSGGATVRGKIYQGLPGAADYAVGPPVTTIQTYLSASMPLQWICVGGGVADGSADSFVPLKPGEIVSVYADGACTRGHTVNTSGANAGQVADTAGSAFTAGQTIGVVLATSGAEGLVRVALSPCWAS